MYQTSLFFHFKAPNYNGDKILRMFFEDWADQICEHELNYSVVDVDISDNETIRVDFMNEEDAVAMKLKGIPDEFKKYLTLV
jgi:hypothetical protein